MAKKTTKKKVSKKTQRKAPAKRSAASKKKTAKKKAAAKNVGGRPEIKIDMKQLAALCRIQCTAEECAEVLGCSEDTIDRRLKELGHAGFAEYRKKHLSAGKVSLRRAQWKKGVEDHDRVMLIWLGKQMLGQKEPHLLQGDPDLPLVSKIVHEVID